MSKELEALSSIAFSMRYRVKPQYVYNSEKENFALVENSLKEAEKNKKAVAMLKDNISLDFTRYPQSGRYEVWLNNGDEEPILIADTKEDYELLEEVFKYDRT